MKKLYKNASMLLMAALCTFTFAACQEFDIDSQPAAAPNIQISAMESYTALATAPSNVVFSVSSNTPWTIESDAQWAVPTPSMSASSSLVSEVVVELEDNKGLESRTATLTIKAEGVEKATVVTINQASKEKLVVVPFDGLAKSEGDVITFELASNKAWEIIPSTAFLSDITPKTGEGTKDAVAETITVKLPANPGAKRSGELTVRTAFEEYTFTIQQNGVVIQQEENPESSEIAMVAGLGEKVIKIAANKAWKVEVPKEFQSWLSAEAVSETELKVVTKAANPLMVPRVGQVIMKTKEVIDGFDGIPFNVSQGTNFWIDGKAEKDEAAGTLTFKSPSRWVPNFSYGTGKVTFNFADVNFPEGENGGIYFNGDCWHWTDGDQFGGGAGGKGWIQIRLFPKGAKDKSSFKLHYQWLAHQFVIEDINAVRKVELDTKPMEDPSKVYVKFSINDKVIWEGERKNVFGVGGGKHQGVKFYTGFEKATDKASFTLKSVEYQTYE